MSTSLFSIGGIASGLDTHSIIEQLLALERRPIQALQQRRRGYEVAEAAWSSIVGKMSGLRTAVDRLREPAWLQDTTAVSSSNTTVADASITGTATPGKLSFHVDTLASAHQIALGEAASTPDQVLGPGTVTLTRADGSAASVELGADATYADAARQLDELDGFSSRLLKLDDGSHRLLVTSELTGAQAAFEVTTDVADLSTGTSVLTQGVDAQLSIGDLLLTRSSNVVDDLLDGVSIELRSQGDVTIEVAQDTDAAVDRITKLVDGLNGLLDEMARQSASSTEASKRGPLSGDGLVRTLSSRLRGALTRISGSAEFGTLASAGISLTREGRVSLDETTLRDALAADPDAVAGLVGKVAEATDERVEVAASGRSQPGTYELTIDVAATIASITGASYTPPGDGYPKTFRIVVPGRDPVEITLTSEHQTVAEAVAHINAELRASGNDRVRASERDGAIHLAADRAGPAGDFTVEDVDGAADLGIVGSAEGTNAEGHLTDANGEVWQLKGLGVTLRATDGPADGLVVSVPTDVTGATGEVVVRDGFASALDRILREAEGSAGSVAGARRSIEGRLESTDDSIEAFERRIELRERTLRRQFTALESAMGQMNQQASWLTQQLAGLQPQG